MNYKINIMCILALVSICFTWHVVSWSEQYGKLAVPPDYDDSITLVEAGMRALAVQQDGVGEMFKESARRHPRSFFHIYWTTFLYSIFGIHEMVVFYASGIFLFGALLAFVLLLPQEISPVWKLSWALVFLGIPVCFHIIHDYRSEVAMAAFLFIGCACALEWIWGSERQKLWFFLTALSFVLALGMKPVMFPYQLGILGLCSMVYLAKQLADRQNSNRIYPIQKWVSCLILLWAMVLIPLLPHFIIHWHSIRDYIVGNSLETTFWNLNEKQGSQYLFHWLGYSGVWYVGGLRYVFAFVLLIGLLCSVVPFLKVYSPGGKWLSLALITIGSYIGISISPMHQPFWGLTFNLLFSATAIVFLAHIFANKCVSKWTFLSILFFLFILNFPALFNRWFIAESLLISIVFLCICRFNFWNFHKCIASICIACFSIIVWYITKPAPYHNYVERTIKEAGAEGLAWRRCGPKYVFESIQNDWRGSDSPKIWFAGYGWVDAKTISWEALKNDKRWYVETLAGAYDKKSNSFAPSTIPESADYFVAPTLGITGEIKMPSTGFDMNTAASSNNQFQLLSEIRAPQGIIRIYKNTH